MIKLMHRRYKISGNYIAELQPSSTALFSKSHKPESIEIEIVVDGKATASDVCRYAEGRYKNMKNLRILSVEFLGWVDVVDLKLEK